MRGEESVPSVDTPGSNGWERQRVGDYLSTDGIERRPSVPRSAYRTKGRFPVVDQGQSLIAGFTDEEDAVHHDDLPLVVFGDHTRAVKFVDFPFATGADGTKLLRPKSNQVDTRFLYYALLNIELPSRGYNRHFSLLREKSFDFPRDPEEQRAIAGVLSKLQARVETQGRIVVTLTELKAATMAKLFREGLRGEALKQTEIGEIPRSWQVVRIGEYCEISSGGTPSRDRREYWGGDIPWVKTAEIDYRPITETEETITALGLDESAARVFPKGTVLMAMYGQGVTRGKVAMLEIDAATNQACAALKPRASLDSTFLYGSLTYAYDRIRDLGHGANQPNLSAEIIRRVLIPLPSSLEEQRQIGTIVRVLDDRIAAAQEVQESWSELFGRGLTQLMSGAIRIPASSKL